MSMFMNAESLYKAKSEHYMEQAEKLQMENTVLLERLEHVEKLLSRHEAG